MLTKNDILTIVYKLASVYTPITELNGSIYKMVRPTGSVLEDCVIGFIGGLNQKFLQDGAVSVKIFYKDLNQNNSYFEDTKRGGELERILYDFSSILLQNNQGISFEIQSRETYTERVMEDQVYQHYAILKLNFLIAK